MVPFPARHVWFPEGKPFESSHAAQTVAFSISPIDPRCRATQVKYSTLQNCGCSANRWFSCGANDTQKDSGATCHLRNFLQGQSGAPRLQEGPKISKEKLWYSCGKRLIIVIYCESNVMYYRVKGFTTCSVINICLELSSPFQNLKRDHHSSV